MQEVSFSLALLAVNVYWLFPMKTQESLSKSADAALMQALRASVSLQKYLEHLSNAPWSTPEMFPKVRTHLAELNQRVHEFNAYHNALTTD